MTTESTLSAREIVRARAMPDPDRRDTRIIALMMRALRADPLRPLAEAGFAEDEIRIFSGAARAAISGRAAR